MADPVTVACAADSWTKVATAVTTGFIWIKDTKPVYQVTYRMNGNPAPTDLSTAWPMPQPGYIINDDNAIDVYVYPVGNNGSVVVAL